MGTNYYTVMNKCEHCGWQDTVHIGKSSAGWQFSFHGTDQIRSWKDWQRVLEGTPGPAIVNEYGGPISIPQLKAIVEGSKGKKDHIQELRDSSDTSCTAIEDAIDAGTDWHDPEGWSFSAGEFS